ncbi:MFS transporter [Mucilaginibacter rubeus]|uniref:MFS transporter n=1 Tax=Mucilaginibacter rubeus TaxID=2027860 RepID=A0AAE6JDZ2_9SPHI|nr:MULTISPECIES: MFS transporter [Mucilaginibacter]QEM03631.1 MFS transporter [Mucilaginibacter rubeus]QEM16243.1 MFS transporter [Mucilaginibacter gossypii]QTE40999.1 MFS transporter [Mucilaginibacter rubeus]QTE47602.1 MFS transporter [Mucilaginibacter rubeus]QTE58993.1 MFS transporter [Mucilaginibacter rubeus]
MKFLTRTVWILSFISLLTDVASEMLYPIMPIYLKSIGFSVLLIGILEGIAEATAGLSKGYFGKVSDSSGRRAPFIRLGYTLSALSKPLMAVTIFPVWIFLARTVDRLGKGIRTGARDALLSDEATPDTKGRVFGFHRSMDTIGAVAGPSLALLYLYVYPTSYRPLFLLAFIPGVLAIGLSFFLKDSKAKPKEDKASVSFFSFLQYWKTSPASYRKLVGGLLMFTLFNSSDVFLLLRIKQAGLSDTATIGVYIFYNIVYAIAAFPLGILADRIGLKKVFITGLLLFVVVYSGMTVTGVWYWYGLLFFMYGLYAAATEGISKAWISNITEKKDTATAIGTYTGFQSICTMLASTLTGWLWFRFGAGPAFTVSALMTLIVAFYLSRAMAEPWKAVG